MHKKTVFSNFIWRFLERCGAQGVTFIVGIILARLLDPAVYGTVALTSVFTSILGVFVNSGLSSALVQKKDADDLDFSSAFYFNIAMSVVLYIMLYFTAPLIAEFYNNSELTKMLRVISISILISGVKNVQQSYVSKHMQFKKFFFSTLAGTIGAAVIGIWMALKGYGAWALIIQSLFNSTVDTMVLWFTVDWHPKRMFSFSRLRVLLSYGWKMLVASLIDSIYSKLTALIIGKRYSTEDLAYYNKGSNYPSVLCENINISISNVLLPAMSAEQDSVERVKTITARTNQIGTYILMPMLMGLAVCAEPLVRLFLTEKWLPIIPYLRVFCFTYALYPINLSNLNAIQAMGHPEIYLRLEIIKKIIGLTGILITMWISVKAMAYSLPFIEVICLFINAAPNKKILNYSCLRQLYDILPQIILTCLMGAIVYIISLLGLSAWLTLIIQIISGVMIYVTGSYFARLESFKYMLSLLKEYTSKKRESTAG